MSERYAYGQYLQHVKRCPACQNQRDHGSEGVKYRVHWADEGLPEETAIATGAARLLEVNGEEVLYIEREDVCRISPREFAERVMEDLGAAYEDGDTFTADAIVQALNHVVAELEGEDRESRMGGLNEVSVYD